MKIWPVVQLWAFIVVIVVLVSGAAILFLPEIRRHQMSEARLIEMKKILEDKSTHLQELQERQRRFKTEPSYVEHVAHELGLAHPGETVFRISESATAPQPAPAQAPRIKLN